MFVAVDKHQHFKSSSVIRHLSGLNTHPTTLKSRLLIISKVLTISSNWVTMFWTVWSPLDRLQASIALCNF